MDQTKPPTQFFLWNRRIQCKQMKLRIDTYLKRIYSNDLMFLFGTNRQTENIQKMSSEWRVRRTSGGTLPEIRPYIPRHLKLFNYNQVVRVANTHK